MHYYLNQVSWMVAKYLLAKFRVAIFDHHEFKVQKIKNRPAPIPDNKSLGLETSLYGTSRG